MTVLDGESEQAELGVSETAELIAGLAEAEPYVHDFTVQFGDISRFGEWKTMYLLAII